MSAQGGGLLGSTGRGFLVSAEGSRRGKPVILRIRAGEMHREGYAFWVSANGVWLTDHVPAHYIDFSDLSD